MLRSTSSLDEARLARGAYAAAVTVCLANLLAYSAIGVVVPVLPLYLRGVLGAGDVTIGAVMGSYAVTTLAARPVGGHWGDRFGYRRPAILGSVLIIVGTAAYGVLPSTAWLVACRLVVGLGEGFSQSACIAWAVSLAPPRSRSAVLAYAGMTGWAGVALGALVGDAALASGGGYGRAFVVGAFGPVIALALLAVVRSARGEEHDAPVSVLQLARAFARPGATYALTTVGYAVVLTFGALLLRAQGAGSASLLLHAFVVGVIAVRVIGGNVPERLGPARTAAWCAAVQAAGTFVVAATATHPFWVAVGGIVAGLGFGLSFPSLALDALGRVPPYRRGVAIGVVSAFFDVGLAASGAVLGWIAERWGYPAAFSFSAACAAMGAVVIGRGASPSARRRSSTNRAAS